KASSIYTKAPFPSKAQTNGRPSPFGYRVQSQAFEKSFTFSLPFVSVNFNRKVYPDCMKVTSFVFAEVGGLFL
ncbi:hypothetical protein C7R93_29860, partial [Brevibacillus fortis]